MPTIENEIIKIHTNELRIGMCISYLETIEGESSLFEQFDIKTQADIQSIQAVCDYIFIGKYQLAKNYDAAIFTESLFCTSYS